MRQKVRVRQNERIKIFLDAEKEAEHNVMPAFKDFMNGLPWPVRTKAAWRLLLGRL